MVSKAVALGATPSHVGMSQSRTPQNGVEYIYIYLFIYLFIYLYTQLNCNDSQPGIFGGFGVNPIDKPSWLRVSMARTGIL